MERRLLVFQTFSEPSGLRQINTSFLAEIDAQIAKIVQTYSLGPPSPSILSGAGGNSIYTCYLPSSLDTPSWTPVRAASDVTGQLGKGGQLAAAAVSHEQLAEQLHGCLDSLPPRGCLLDLLWVCDATVSDVNVELFGALERAVSWHGAALTLVTSTKDPVDAEAAAWLTHLRAEVIPSDHLCDCHGLKEFIGTSLVWRGSLAFYHEDEAKYEKLPGFELHFQRDELDFVMQKIHLKRGTNGGSRQQANKQPPSSFAQQLEFLTEVDLAAVPQHLITNQWLVLKTSILDSEDELVHDFLNQGFLPDGKGMIARLRYSTGPVAKSAPRAKLDTTAWKEAVLTNSCHSIAADDTSNVLTTHCLHLLLFNDASLPDGDCSRTTYQLAALLLRSSPSDLAPCLSLREATAIACQQLSSPQDVDDLVKEIPSYDVTSRVLNMPEIRRRMRNESASILDCWLRNREPVLEQLEPEELIVAIQEQLMKSLLEAGVLEPLVAGSPLLLHSTLTPGDQSGASVHWAQNLQGVFTGDGKDSLRYLQQQQEKKLAADKTGSGAGSSGESKKETVQTLSVLEAVGSCFTPAGSPVDSRQLEPVVARNGNCPLRPQKSPKSYADLVAENFEPVADSFKGFRFKGESFPALAFTQYHDVYYNTGEKAEEYDRECKRLRDIYVGPYKETLTSLTADHERTGKHSAAAIVLPAAAAVKRRQGGSDALTKERIAVRKSPRKIAAVVHVRPSAELPRKLLQRDAGSSSSSSRQLAGGSRQLMASRVGSGRSSSSHVLAAQTNNPPTSSGSNSRNRGAAIKSAVATTASTAAAGYSREEKKVRKLREAVFDALGRRSVGEKDPIFRHCFRTLFSACKLIVDSVPDSVASSQFMRTVAESNVKNIVDAERLRRKQLK